MKTKKIAITIAGSIIIALARISALAQQPVITSFHGNGQLTWTNLPGTNGFTVQWAPAVPGPWSSNWLALDSLVVTGSQTTASVPMFYRVAQGFTPASVRGIWFMVGTTAAFPNNYFIAQDDGTLSEGGLFNMKHPAGYFTVTTSGRFTNTFVGNQSITLSGTFAGANLINWDPPYTNIVTSRLDDASRCAGNWTGTLSQTNGSGTPISYPVSFSVDNRGLVTNFTGFAGPAMGRMFALANGAAVGFFSLGKDNDVNGVYWEIAIAGTLTGNTFSGSYSNDSGSGPAAVSGTASLTRQ